MAFEGGVRHLGGEMDVPWPSEVDCDDFLVLGQDAAT